MSDTIMENILRSPLLTPWRDPQSEVTSYLLAHKAAPWQQAFYFVNDGFSADGRYLWFYCGFPPAGSHNAGLCLGVADFVANEIRCYHETQFLDASPAVDPLTGDAYWCSGVDVWKRGAAADAKVEFVNRLPDALVKNRRPWRVATHLTFCADRQRLNFDALIGTDSFVGDIPLDGTAPRVWQQFDRCYNHAQFSPADADLMLLAQDSATHPVTGEVSGIDNRMWLLRRGGKARPVLPVSGSGMDGHEWWGADGKTIWFVRYHEGVLCTKLDEMYDEAEGADITKTKWKLDTVSFAHASRDGQRLVANCAPLPGTNNVQFLNLETERETVIASALPPLPLALTQRYHWQAMPRFCCGDRFIVYTTTVSGSAGVALVPVGELL